MGYTESSLAMWLAHLLQQFLDRNDLGNLAGPDGTLRLMPLLVRMPDISFVRWEKLPGRELPSEPMPDLVPDLAIEILSEGNTPGEMKRKLKEYFITGVHFSMVRRPRAAHPWRSLRPPLIDPSRLPRRILWTAATSAARAGSPCQAGVHPTAAPAGRGESQKTWARPESEEAEEGRPLLSHAREWRAVPRLVSSGKVSPPPKGLPMTRFRASLLATALLTAPASAQPRTPDAETFFEVQVRPVLAGPVCFKCHGGEKMPAACASIRARRSSTAAMRRGHRCR